VSAESQSSELRTALQTRSSPFKVQQVVIGGRHTLVLTGELDLTSAPVLAATVAHIPMDRTTNLVLDLRKLTFIDSTGIRTILVTRELCAEFGGEFSIIPAGRRVRRTLEICGLLDQLPLRNDEQHVYSETSEAIPSWGPASDRLARHRPQPPREPPSGDDS
jgi:anti-sigma B factor antagonist